MKKIDNDYYTSYCLYDYFSLELFTLKLKTHEKNMRSCFHLSKISLAAHVFLIWNFYFKWSIVGYCISNINIHILRTPKKTEFVKEALWSSVDLPYELALKMQSNALHKFNISVARKMWLELMWAQFCDKK